MEKIANAELRHCTVFLDSSECAIRFENPDGKKEGFRAFAIKNDGAADVYISKTSGIVPDADGVMCVKSGASAIFAHMDIYADTVYLLGTGKVQVHAQNDTANPFNFAPTFDGGVTASGNPVVMDNLQGGMPFSEMVVSGKNLITYPYYHTTMTNNGITFTDNGDGSITVNGTATADTPFYFMNKQPFELSNTELFLSGCPNNGSISTFDLVMAALDDNNNLVGVYNDTGNGFKIFIPNTAKKINVYIRIRKEQVINNLIFRPQLEYGTAPTAYEPPITGRELTVGVCGKNLIPYPFAETTKTINGVTFTVNADGSITANGTATNNARFYTSLSLALPIGEYTLSDGNHSAVSEGCNIQVYKSSDPSATLLATTFTNKSFVLTEPTILTVRILVAIGNMVDNLVIKPQLELGSTPTEYEPYHGSTTIITPDNNPYVIPNDIRQVEGLNNVSVSAGEISVTGVRKNKAIKRIWDKLDELTTAIIVSNGESE